MSARGLYGVPARAGDDLAGDLEGLRFLLAGAASLKTIRHIHLQARSLLRAATAAQDIDALKYRYRRRTPRRAKARRPPAGGWRSMRRCRNEAGRPTGENARH